MKRAFLKCFVVGVVLVGAIAPQPAGASQLTGGALGFTGTAALPSFPCAAPAPGSLPCNGTFTGTIAGDLNGVTASGVPWAIAVATDIPSTNPVRFTYFDGIEPGAKCIEGSARATGTINADQLKDQVTGLYGQGQLPRSVVSASIEFDFSWYRIGTTANMKFNRLRVVLTVFGIATPIEVINVTNSSVANGAPGYGVAAFLPAATQEMLEACEGVRGPVPITATVAGNADFAVVIP